MKKKILVAALAVIMVVTAIAGASLAYLTDKDNATNIMTLGNVDIEQHEKDVTGADFEQDQDLFPMVDLRKEGDAVLVDGENGEKVFNPAMNNVIDKFVTVENTGDYDAYVRTILAFQTVRSYKEGSSTEFVDLHKEYIGVNGTFEYLDQYIEIDGVEYILAVCVYEDAVAPGETTSASLRQFFMAPTANNEITSWFGNNYKILALSQAVQTAGFESAGAEFALNTAFGKITEDAAQGWFAEFAA